MSEMLQKLFPEGHRKLVVSLIGLVAALVLDHFHQLNDTNKNAIIALVGIFVAGNVGEHFADAAKLVLTLLLKGTKIGKTIEDLIPGDQGLGDGPAPAMAQAAVGPSVGQLGVEKASQAAQLASEAHDRIADLEKKVAVSNQNIGQIVQILNQMRGAANGARPAAPAQPQG